MKLTFYVTVCFGNDCSVLSRTFASESEAREYMKANWPDLEFWVKPL